jgi:hypothetical protein
MFDENNSGPRLSPQALASATDYKCEKCEHSYFVPVVALKHLSAIMSPTGKEVNFPVQTFACAKCGHVNEEFVPKLS